MVRRSKLWNLEQEELNTCESYADVLRNFEMHVGAGNYNTLKRVIERKKLDASHIPTGPNHRRGKIINRGYGKYASSFEEMFSKNSPWKTKPQRLKRRLFEEGIWVEEKCSSCGLGSEWNGKPITLQLDHINGDRNDNRVENLRLLCPNCHSQTSTFGGRNIDAPIV